jgi:signal transduction histidine kinase
MAAVDTFAAREGMELRHWRVPAMAISWRDLAVVSLVALLLSTQILFQAGVDEVLASGTLVSAWAQYFAEALACGIVMWLAVAGFERWALWQGMGREIGAALILFVGAFAAQCAFLAAAQPEGFFPPMTAVAGDALRWWLWGVIVYAAHSQAQRHARAALLLAVERVERERADQRRAEADVALLQAQIQPHFLFNLFAHVRRLYRVGHDDGRDAVERLRGYLKEVLGAISGPETTVKRELQLVQAYLQLMKIALGDRLTFAIDASPAVLDVRIPPLSVLTLAENAVKHGIAGAARAGVVHVVARREGATALIEVRDDGPGVAASSGSGMGLANTKARLRAMHGANARLSLQAIPGCGAVAAIEIGPA